MSNNYFKGWYFKCASNDKTIAFIPAYHRSNRRETASLQITTMKTIFPQGVKTADVIYLTTNPKAELQ